MIPCSILNSQLRTITADFDDVIWHRAKSDQLGFCALIFPLLSWGRAVWAHPRGSSEWVNQSSCTSKWGRDMSEFDESWIIALILAVHGENRPEMTRNHPKSPSSGRFSRNRRQLILRRVSFMNIHIYSCSTHAWHTPRNQPIKSVVLPILMNN